MKNPLSLTSNCRNLIIPALICSLSILHGCGDDDEIEVYDAPRPAVASDTAAHGPNDGHNHGDMAAAQPAAMPAAQPTASGQFSFTLPEGWQQVEPGSMILFRFATPATAMINVSAFPGDVGGVVANVQRWRGQLGLPQVSPDEITSALKPDKLGSFDAQRVDLANETQRLVVCFGMVEGKTWFVKLTGTTEQIDATLPAFDAFLGSVNWK